MQDYLQKLSALNREREMALAALDKRFFATDMPVANYVELASKIDTQYIHDVSRLETIRTIIERRTP